MIALAPRTVQNTLACVPQSGLFAVGTDYGLAASFDDTGADEQVLTTEFGIAHALGVVVKVTGLNADPFRQLRTG